MIPISASAIAAMGLPPDQFVPAALAQSAPAGTLWELGHDTMMIAKELACRESHSFGLVAYYLNRKRAVRLEQKVLA